MNSAATFSLEWSLGTIFVAVFFWIATAIFSVWTVRRSGYRRDVITLEALRLVIVGFAGFLLNQPEWVEEFLPSDRPVIAVLTDDSTSMETRDVIVGANVIPRREVVESLTKPETWNDLSKDFEVVFESIRGEGTDLATPLGGLLEKHLSLVGVVLASDGDWNQGGPPLQVANRYRNRGVPVFTLPVGSQTRLPDLELVSFDVPTFAVVGKSVRIPFSINSSLPRDTIVNVTMTVDGGESVTQEVRVLGMNRTSDAIVWRPEVVGDVTLTLDVPPQVGEVIDENNRLSAPISIREEKLRVLVVESYPRWEYRYLRNALSRDPGIEVSCLLFHPDLEKRGGGNTDYISEFPEGKDSLAEFDVVFLGDVGMVEGQLTEEQCTNLKGLVEQQASGLVFIPGPYGNHFSLLDSALGSLYPVQLEMGQPNGWGAPLANHFQLTEAGRRSLLTKLADTEDENGVVWENLPGFQWYAPVIKARPGTETLAVHSETSNEFGRLPLLVTRTFGAGKVLFMGTDGAWRWRKGVEDVYHYRFWGQVVRWMAYRRNMARGETMRLYYSPEQPQVRQRVTLSANVMDRSGEPLESGNVTVRIVAPSGQADTIRMQASGESWGAFSGSFTPQEPGSHKVTLACVDTKMELEVGLYVQGAPLEKIGQPAKPETLEEIAKVTRGLQLETDKIEELMQSLAVLPQPSPLVRRVQLWSHPVVAGAMIFLLGTFWVGRKFIGFI